MHDTKLPTITQDCAIPVPGIQELIGKYQDPSKADPVTKIEKELYETREVLACWCILCNRSKILIKSIDDLLERDRSLKK